MVTGTPDPFMVYDACRRVTEQVHRDVNPHDHDAGRAHRG